MRDHVMSKDIQKQLNRDLLTKHLHPPTPPYGLLHSEMIFSMSPIHSILTPAPPVLELTPKHQASGRVTTRMECLDQERRGVIPGYPLSHVLLTARPTRQCVQ